MEWEIVHLDETDSTNRWIKDHGDGSPDHSCQAMTVQENCPYDSCVVADYQTAGRGCGTNRWESERGKNLLFSLLIHPSLSANRQFQISMAISLAICDALEHLLSSLVPHPSFLIKWPNDIYWREGKIAGILIENRLQGTVIRDSIVGVGLNVNQQQFYSDAPNPVSLLQIVGHAVDREQLLHNILDRFLQYLERDIRQQYLSLLYRRQGFHPYRDQQGSFMAELETVEEDGHLVLRDDGGRQRRYAFKEVIFLSRNEITKQH